MAFLVVIACVLGFWFLSLPLGMYALVRWLMRLAPGTGRLPAFALLSWISLRSASAGSRPLSRSRGPTTSVSARCDGPSPLAGRFVHACDAQVAPHAGPAGVRRPTGEKIKVTTPGTPDVPRGRSGSGCAVHAANRPRKAEPWPPGSRGRRAPAAAHHQCDRFATVRHDRLSAVSGSASLTLRTGRLTRTPTTEDERQQRRQHPGNCPLKLTLPALDLARDRRSLLAVRLIVNDRQNPGRRQRRRAARRS